MDRELLLTLNSLWLSVCLNIRLLCRFVCPCVCVCARYKVCPCQCGLYICCVHDKHVDLYSKHEWIWPKGCLWRQGSIDACIQYVFSVRVFVREKERETECVCMSEGKQSRSVSTAWGWCVRCQRKVSECHPLEGRNVTRRPSCSV